MLFKNLVVHSCPVLIKKPNVPSFVQLYTEEHFYGWSRHGVKVAALVFLVISPVKADPVAFPRLPRAGK